MIIFDSLAAIAHENGDNRGRSISYLTRTEVRVTSNPIRKREKVHQKHVTHNLDKLIRRD